MRRLKNIVKELPIVPSIYRYLRDTIAVYKTKLKSTEQVFSEIYNNNTWGGKHSFSGVGSEENQTRKLVEELPRLLTELRVETMLDIPCGDFYWMKKIDLETIEYIGADIVEEIVKENTNKFRKDGITFQKLDIIRDDLPQTSLIICRDCLVHFSYADIFRAVANICESQSKYVLTTTFTKTIENRDIITGKWRALNLECAPFMFPAPLKIIEEGCTQGNGAYADKSLGLWRTRDLIDSLTKRN